MPPPTTPDQPTTPQAQSPQAECWIMLAFNAADMIDLPRAEQALAQAGTRRYLKPSKRAPSSASTQSASLRTTESAQPFQLAGEQTDNLVQLTLYDFGVISVTYRVPINPQPDLTTHPDYAPLVAAATAAQGPLRDDASARVKRLLAAIADAADSPTDDFTHIEDYIVFRFPPFDDNDAQQRYFSERSEPLARTLRASPWPLSAEETSDAIASRTSYTPTDAVVIDWNAAAIFDTPTDADETLIVLEYANAQLLELRLLDEQLDTLLDNAWRVVESNREKRFPLFSLSGQTELARIGALQVDAAIAAEAAGNALKLLGDQYLARVYSLAGKRFRIPDWNSSIARKLAVTENIYEKLTDRQSTRRMEILEWIIIILIAVSIATYFF